MLLISKTSDKKPVAKMAVRIPKKGARFASPDCLILKWYTDW